jgi:hypothetical protein
MAGITIPLITEFKDKGIKQAMKEFKALETTGEESPVCFEESRPACHCCFGRFGCRRW